MCLGKKGSSVSGGERVCASFVRAAVLLGQGTVCGILMPGCKSQPVWKGQRGREVLAAIGRAPARGLPGTEEPWKLSGPLCPWGAWPFSAELLIPPAPTGLLCSAARKLRYLLFKYLSFAAAKYCPFKSGWLYPCSRRILALIFMCLWRVL